MQKYYENKPAELFFALLPNPLFNNRKISIKKFKNIFYLLLPLLFLFSSCKDDPVTVKKTNEDTTDVYDWAIDTIYGYNCNNPYAADSDNVFISAYPVPVYFNGKIYEPINLNDPLFICDVVAGYDKNNVFFGGGISGTYWGDPVLKKWTNSNLTTYTVTGDSGVAVSDIFVEEPNQCWFSTGEKFKVYHFDAGTIIPYSLDSGCRMTSFYRDISGALFAFALKTLSLYDFEFSYYKFSNESFHLIGKDTVTQTSEMKLGAFRCGTDLLRTGKNSVFYFKGSGWERLCNTDFDPRLIAGISKDNFLCYGGQPQTGTWEIYTWNGTQWKRERSKNIYHGLADPAISVTNTRVEIILFISSGLNYHLRGKLRK